METFSRNYAGNKKDNIRSFVFKTKKIITDTVSIDYLMWYMVNYIEFGSPINITIKVDLIFFKNNEIFKEHFEQKETQQESFIRLRGDSIKEIYDKI